MPQLNCDLDRVHFHLTMNGLNGNVAVVPFWGHDGSLQPFVTIRFLERIATGSYAEIVGAISDSKSLVALFQICRERRLLRPKLLLPKMLTFVERDPRYWQLLAFRDDANSARSVR